MEPGRLRRRGGPSEVRLGPSLVHAPALVERPGDGRTSGLARRRLAAHPRVAMAPARCPREHRRDPDDRQDEEGCGGDRREPPAEPDHRHALPLARHAPRRGRRQLPEPAPDERLRDDASGHDDGQGLGVSLIEVAKRSSRRAALGHTAAMAVPTGNVTFLLTDIEGSTRNWDASQSDMRAALSRHDELLARDIRDHGGEVLTERGEGDSFFAVFPTATGAVAAALAIQLAIGGEPWPDRAPITGPDGAPHGRGRPGCAWSGRQSLRPPAVARPRRAGPPVGDDRGARPGRAAGRGIPAGPWPAPPARPDHPGAGLPAGPPGPAGIVPAPRLPRRVPPQPPGAADELHRPGGRSGDRHRPRARASPRHDHRGRRGRKDPAGPSGGRAISWRTSPTVSGSSTSRRSPTPRWSPPPWRRRSG